MQAYHTLTEREIDLMEQGLMPTDGDVNEEAQQVDRAPRKRITYNPATGRFDLFTAGGHRVVIDGQRDYGSNLEAEQAWDIACDDDPFLPWLKGNPTGDALGWGTQRTHGEWHR